MRVLHVLPSYLPAVRYGGPVIATHGLCRALVRAGCDVSVFTTNVDGESISPVPIEKPVMLDGVSVRYFPVPRLRRLYYSPAMGRALNEECAGFDVLQLHSVFLWPTWAAARAARRAGIPYLVSPRGMLVQDLIARKSALLKRAWIALIERRNLERAAGIHVTSRLEALELQRFGLALPALHEVPNGVDAAGGEGGADALPAEVETLLGSGRAVILALGRINWKKGLDRLIPALARLPEAILLIVGNDEEGHIFALRDVARREGVSDRLAFAGPVFGSAKAALYRRASVLALASYSENFGNVVLEAMAEGCPVVVTPEVGAAPIVEELGGGLVVQGNPQALAEGLQKLLRDPALRAAMGKRAGDLLRVKYSWDAVAGRMMEVYRQAMAVPRLRH